MCSGDEDSVGEDYYSDADGVLGESDGSNYDDSNETKVVLPEKRYSILSHEDIHRRQQEDITEVASVLSLSRSAATALLCNYNWDVIKVQDTWFADEEGVRMNVGLLKKQVFDAKSVANKLCCQICFELFPHSLMVAASCGHPFCGACWTGYVSSSINDGSGCLTLRCPFPQCNAAVGEDMINILASEDDKAKYSHFLLRSYIEGSNKTKWCPAPGCEYVVDFVIGSDNFDVTCRCTHYFCWNCMEEAHRPLDCGTVGKWILKNSAESENTNWILANSKPCPKCKRPIEKNQGCMHMTCYSPCRFQFCWLCLGEWSQHGERSGGFYSCNGYENFKKQGEYEESERRRKMAKISLEKYTHYFERWAANHLSRQKALQNLQDMKDVQVHKLTARYSQPHSQLAFIIDAWLQIVECRRILKWTYAFGYYFSEEKPDKKQFFEYLQGEAEHGLERLHKCAEKELEPFIASEEDRLSPLPSLEAFHTFRTKLVGLTKVTNVFFENLMRALEDGFTEFDGCSKRVSSKNLGGESQGDHSWIDASHWSCTHCTFANPSDAVLCEICHNNRTTKQTL